MGLVLDSSAAVAAERQGKNAKQLLETIAREAGDDDLALSVITLLELSHGLARANTAERRDQRQRVGVFGTSGRKVRLRIGIVRLQRDRRPRPATM